MRHSASTLLIAVAASLASCSDATAPDTEQLVPGAIKYGPYPAVVTVPDSIQAGEAFIVTVATYAGDCLSAGPTEVAYDDLTAVVSPYDVFHEGTGAVCGGLSRGFIHDAELRFDRPGRARIEFHGRSMPQEGFASSSRYVEVH